MNPKRKAEDFTVGQMVTCTNPESFLSEKRRYLTGRTGVVENIWPSTADPNRALRLNEVKVRWLKKNGRGNEQTMLMRPEDLTQAEG